MNGNRVFGAASGLFARFHQLYWGLVVKCYLALRSRHCLRVVHLDGQESEDTELLRGEQQQQTGPGLHAWGQSQHEIHHIES